MYLGNEIVNETITKAYWIIGIIILCTVAAIIVPKVKEALYEKYENKVIETSQRYLDIQKVNREYNFNEVPPYIFWNIALDSKGKYDRLDLNHFFVDKDYIKSLKMSWKIYHQVECQMCAEERR